MHWGCIGHDLVTYLGRFGDASEKYWGRIGDALGMHLGRIRDAIEVASRTHRGRNGN